MTPAEAKRTVMLFHSMLFDEEMEDIQLYDLGEAEEGVVERSGGDATYGEVSFELLEWMLEGLVLHTEREEVLCDLGSGGGEALLYLALRTGCNAVGVELSETRHKSAEAMLNLARPLLRPGQRVALHHGDITERGGPQEAATAVLFANRLFDEEFAARALATTPKARQILALRPVAGLEDVDDVKEAALPTSWMHNQPVWLYTRRST